MSYTPPAGDAANVSWVGVAPYTPPAGDAANVSWVEVPAGVVGEGYVVFDFTPAGVGVHGSIVTGSGAVVLDFVPAVAGRHGVAGTASVVFDFVPTATAVHPRYEARGVVRQGGVLLNRRVRLYDRLTGALLSQGDTAAGKFALHAGFAEAEVYAVPIDLSDDAVDWRPPVANRVRTVLAQDVTP